jgi:hypothetical protein
MRRVVLASLLLTAFGTGRAQDAAHEYRPEIAVTLPRLYGFGLQLLVEQHLATSDLAPNERTQGVGLVTPTLYAPLTARFVMEVRQVIMPTVTEHRYIPTVLTAAPLGAGFELRNRTRVEVRNINRAISERWQDRSAVGHDVDVFGWPVWTYGQVDFSYDSRFSTINRTEQQGGARFPIAPGASIDLFFLRQNDTRRTVPLIYATGAVIRVVL